MEVITYETNTDGKDIAVVKTLPYEDMKTLAISLGATGLIHTISLFVNPMYNVLVTNQRIKTKDVRERRDARLHVVSLREPSYSVCPDTCPAINIRPGEVIYLVCCHDQNPRTIRVIFNALGAQK